MWDRWTTVLPFALIFLIIFVRRFRRSFGRQRFRPRGLIFVIALMGGVALVLLVLSRTPVVFQLAGAAVGSVLALWALSRTRFGVDATGRFYVPDGVTGLIVLLLFFGRVLLRLSGIAGPLDGVGDLDAASAPTFASSPGMMAALYVLLGYYVAYYGGVLVRGSRLEASEA